MDGPESHVVCLFSLSKFAVADGPHAFQSIVLLQTDTIRWKIVLLQVWNAFFGSVICPPFDPDSGKFGFVI